MAIADDPWDIRWEMLYALPCLVPLATVDYSEPVRPMTTRSREKSVSRPWSASLLTDKRFSET